MAKRITTGRKGNYGKDQAPQCKMVTVVIGDNETDALSDIESAMNTKMPIIVLSGSPLCNEINETLSRRTELPHANDSFKIGEARADVLERLNAYSRVVSAKDSSEEIASLVHLLLTISI